MRPVFINLVNNPDYGEPRVTIKRDAFLDEFNRDVVVPDVNKLSELLVERNVETDVPMYVTCEWRHTWNITFIDTPGLLDPEDFPEEQVDREAIRAATLELISKPERIIIAVEDTNVESGYKIADFAKLADASLDRTLFVHTKLDKALESVAQNGGSTALNSYLGAAPRLPTTYWCSFPWGRSRSKYNTRDLLMEKTVQMAEADMRSLEELQFDRRFVNQFGIKHVRNFLVQLLWRRFQEVIPNVQKALQSKKQTTSAELSRVSNQISNLDVYKLRAAASSYVMSFLQTVEKLVSGTLAGNPGQNGETLAQEHADENAGPWMDCNHQVINFDPDDLDIPNADARLYGGQQFARLLKEFRAICSTVSIGEISKSEVATAAGPSRVNNASVFAWAASDLAQKRCQRALMPLVEHLFTRASHILVRLADIVMHIVESQAKAERQQQTQMNSAMGGLSGASAFASVLQAQLISVEDYPYFVQHVKALYSEFVQQASKTCAEKCLDEFYCTRILYWDVNNRKEPLPDVSKLSDDDAVKAVGDFAGKLFDELRERIVENVLLKCHHFFLVPVQTDLWGDVQGKVTQLEDQAIAEMFQVTTTRDRFKRDEEKLRNHVRKLQDQEMALQQSVNGFSHPLDF